MRESSHIALLALTKEATLGHDPILDGLLDAAGQSIGSLVGMEHEVSTTAPRVQELEVEIEAILPACDAIRCIVVMPLSLP